MCNLSKGIIEDSRVDTWLEATRQKNTGPFNATANEYDTKEESMAILEVPANSTVQYRLSVILVTANTGSVRNYFTIENK